MTGDDKALDVPAIVGIGGSLLYFVDKYGAKGSAYDDEFDWLGEHDPKPKGVGFYYLDHLTHNVYRGNMDKWWAFYRELFSFKQIHFFDIDGSITGLVSRAITSPCGKIRIPLNEVQGRHQPDRGVPEEIQGRRHPAHRRRDRRHLRRHRHARRQRPEVHARPARDLLRAVARPRARP